MQTLKSIIQPLFFFLESITTCSYLRKMSHLLLFVDCPIFSQTFSSRVIYMSYMCKCKGICFNRKLNWHLFQLFCFILELSTCTLISGKKQGKRSGMTVPNSLFLGEKYVLEHKFENPKMCKANMGSTCLPHGRGGAAGPAAVWVQAADHLGALCLCCTEVRG